MLEGAAESAEEFAGNDLGRMDADTQPDFETRLVHWGPVHSMIPLSAGYSPGFAAHSNRQAVGVNFPAQVRRCIAHNSSTAGTAVAVTESSRAEDREDCFGCTS